MSCRGLAFVVVVRYLSVPSLFVAALSFTLLDTDDDRDDDVDEMHRRIRFSSLISLLAFDLIRISLSFPFNVTAGSFRLIDGFIDEFNMKIYL
jgi:hypothetical protein